MSELFFPALEELRKRSIWFVITGAILIVLGFISLGASVFTTLATMIFIGSLMIIAGIAQVVHAFYCKKWSGFFVDLAAGILYAVVGFLMVANPGASAVSLTLLIAMFLMFGGVMRIVVAAVDRFPGWGWHLFHGVVNVLLAFAIWNNWPSSGLWVIGMFVGIDMLINGLSLLMLGLSIRGLPHAHVKRESTGQMTMAS